MGETPVPRQAGPYTSFAPIVKRVAPGVVKVKVTAKATKMSMPQGFVPNDPFWQRFFGDPSGNQVPNRQFSQLRKDGDRFSDVYCAFQEERHAELDIEERAQFNPKHFKHEAAAVTRLIEMARELIAQKKFPEAMEYLDATQLSDLRVKQAQVLKSECLRSLGKNAEADKVLKESLAAWPQMTALRKCFRFLGMVANDGKRLLVGLTEKGRRGAK